MNSKLKDRVFKIPLNIIKFLQQQKSVEGVDRNKNLLETGQVTYGQLKRILHDMKYIDKDIDSIKYNLYGGDLMRDWGNTTLKNERDLIVNKEKDARIANDISGLTGERKNPSIKKHTKNTLSPRVNSNDVEKLNSSMFSASSLKLTEEINKIKKLML